MCKETSVSYCDECCRDFIMGEVVHFTWYENRFFCDECKQIMNKRVRETYLDWKIYKVSK